VQNRCYAIAGRKWQMQPASDDEADKAAGIFGGQSEKREGSLSRSTIPCSGRCLEGIASPARRGGRATPRGTAARLDARMDANGMEAQGRADATI
jgi:hypothetical protein